MSISQASHPQIAAEEKASYSILIREQTLLMASWLLCVLYPWKGLLNLGIVKLTGWHDSSIFLVPMISLTTLLCTMGNFFLYRGAFRILDVALFFAGVFSFAVSLVRVNLFFSQIAFLILVLPLLLFPAGRVKDSFIRKLLGLHFGLIALYMLGEFILLHTHLLGLTHKILISKQQLSDFYELLSMTRRDMEDIQLVQDNRTNMLLTGQAGIQRPGGFVANPVQLPGFISMGASYFYVSLRQNFTWKKTLALAIALFGVGVCLSVTGVFAFFATVLFFEIYRQRGYKKILIIPLILGVLVTAVLIPGPVAHVFMRAVLNIREYDYIGRWTAYDPEVILAQGPLRLIITALIGQQGWIHPWNVFQCENDLVNLMTGFGIIIGSLAIWRLVYPALRSRGAGDKNLTLFSMVALNGAICLVHRDTMIAPNTYMLLVLLNVKCYWLLAKHRTPNKSFQEK